MRALMLAILFGSTAIGATPPAPPPGCTDPDHRAFDFWIGDWQVHKPDGTVGGHNRITREYGGCVIHEHYTSTQGYSGESLNTYDAARKVWHQTWVDNTGLLLLLDGGMRDGAMVLEGQTTGSDGVVTKQRITWTPNPDGSVRQFWQAAGANGEWSTVFDGKYTRVSPSKKR